MRQDGGANAFRSTEPCSSGNSDRSLRSPTAEGPGVAELGVDNSMMGGEICRDERSYHDVRYLKPVIEAMYPLTAASDAQRQMEAGGFFGKVVLTRFHK